MAAMIDTCPFLEGAISAAVNIAKVVPHQSLTAHRARDGSKVGLRTLVITENNSWLAKKAANAAKGVSSQRIGASEVWVKLVLGR